MKLENHMSSLVGFVLSKQLKLLSPFPQSSAFDQLEQFASDLAASAMSVTAFASA